MKRVWLFLFFLHLGYFPAYSIQSQVAQDSILAEIEAIPVSEITKESQSENQLFTEIDSYLKDFTRFEELGVDFDSISVEIDETIDAFDTTTTEYTDFQVNSFQNLFQSYNSVLETYEEILNRRTSKLEDYREELRQDKLEWEKTKEVLVTDDTPDALLETLQNVLGSITNTDKDIVAQQDLVFGLQTEVINKKALINQVLKTLEQVKFSLVQKVFTVDSPPFWNLLADSTQITSTKQQLVTNWGNAKVTVNAFVDINSELLIIHLVIIILLAIVILYLKRRQEKLIHYSTQEELWILFKYPVELAFVLGVVVFTPPYQQSPEIINDFFVLFIFLIVFRLFFKVIDVPIRVAYGILAVFLTFNTLLSFVSQVQIPARIIMLFQSLICIAIFIGVYRKGIKNYKFFDLWLGRVMTFFIPIGLLVFGFSILTNLLGASAFTKYLLYGSIRSIAAAICFFAGVMVLNGILAILLQNPKAKAVYLVKEHSAQIAQRLKGIIQVFFLYEWLRFSLESFKIWEEFVAWFQSIMGFAFESGDFSITVGTIFISIITIVTSFWMANLIKTVLEKELFQRMTLPRGVSGVISTSTYYFIVIVGFIIALSLTGIEMTQISIVVGALSVGIGFGLQNIVSNFISGIILVFERPVQEGDTVEVGTLMGDVKSIGIRSSKVRTYDGSEVIVPNNNLISDQVINWTLSDRKRRSTVEVGVAYGTNPGKVAKLLTETAAAHPKCFKDPGPQPIFVGFGDSSLNFKIHFWTYFEDGYVSKSEVTMAIYDALEKEGIEIPFPQRVLTMKKDSDDPQEVK